MSDSHRSGPKAWLALQAIPGLGRRRIAQLAQHFGSAENIVSATAKELAAIKGITLPLIDAIQHISADASVERELVSLEKMGAGTLTFEDERYPSLLREIPDPPPLLFYLGDASTLDTLCLAIVGARRASSYGRRAAEVLAADLARAGVTIVSGMARGIDTCAHRGALGVGGKTIAVLGSGLDVPYPKENQGLLEQIAHSGTVLSEFRLGASPEPHHFPVRNRIISGLCFGTLIVEAADRSGSLITVSQAIEQNREVFAVPGNITSLKSLGPNTLIQKGAKLVRRWQDVLEECPEWLGSFGEETFSPSRNTPSFQSDAEQHLYEVLNPDQPVHIDDLAQITSLDHATLATSLLTLEIQGLVRQLPGKQFLKNTIC